MASTGSSLEPALRGRLEQFGLATVLTFLDLERRSGELVVVVNDGVPVRLFLVIVIDTGASALPEPATAGFLVILSKAEMPVS